MSDADKQLGCAGVYTYDPEDYPDPSHICCGCGAGPYEAHERTERCTPVAGISPETRERACLRCPHKSHEGYVCTVYTDKEARLVCGCREATS